MLKKLDFYILRKFLGTFFFIIGLFILIAVVFDISEKIDDFLEEDVTLREIVFQYYFSFIPWIYSTLAPLLGFLAVIFFTSKMASKTEVIPILSSGVSFSRFLRPYFVGAVILLIISLLMSHFVIPKTNRNKIEFEKKLYWGKFNRSNSNVYMEVKPNHYLFLKSYSKTADIGYDFRYQIIEDGELKYQLSGSNLKWNAQKKHWIIKDWYQRKIQSDGELSLERGVTKDTVLSFDKEEFHKEKRYMVAMDYFELKEHIKEERAKGSIYVKDYEMEHIKRTAIPFSILILTFIGVCLSSKKVRGGIGEQFAYGLALASSYVFLGKVGEVFAINTPISTELAIWIPNIVYAAIAVWIYRIAPK